MPGARALLLCSLGLCLQRGLTETRAVRHPPARIAIIGAGIGGTSAAYFVRQKFGDHVPIDVFERGDVGGRLATVEIEGKEYEAGGAVIHPLNLHMKMFVEKLGLSARPPSSSLLGIYNGKEFVFEESSWFIINMIKIVWYYGFNFLRMFMWVEDMMDKFMRVYRYQTSDYSFTSTEALLHALGGKEFIQRLNKTIDETMQQAGFSQKFIDEIVTPAMRVNYGQGAQINGFVGAVSLAGTESGLWAVDGGNKVVCTGLLYASKANLIKGYVNSVEQKTRPLRTGEGAVHLYQVNYNTDSGESYSQYDIVLVATPLNNGMSGIQFPSVVPAFKKHYHQTVATFVQGQINSTFFGCPKPCELRPTEILTTENPDLFFSSIGVVTPVKVSMKQSLGKPASDPVWKVFSPEPLTAEQLRLLFVTHGEVKTRTWLAYPHYHPPERLPPIMLHERIYYVNSIEAAASAMEMSALSAKNVALLAYHHWYDHLDKIDQEDLNEKIKSEL
ncbi:prenylcysteine oxidase 1 [Ambystoma mexicanum]|uniref:prenylcysteine oxidase 1 n=1 Tax=Ambystoma mexicanum TaxID=8296 RepID=UPI0037E980EE